MKSQEVENFTNSIIWTVEAKFCKNGLFNRHNSHFWSKNIPRAIRERRFQEHWSFNVFCAIKNDRVFDLYFYDRIRGAFNKLDGPVIKKATSTGVLKRIKMCLNNDGNVFEHLL